MHSLWTDTEILPQYLPLNGDAKVDVLIVGGGLAGILTAYAMKETGLDCLLIEANEICSGVTQNTTAKITSQHGLIYSRLYRQSGAETARLYYNANQAAIKYFARLAEKHPCDFELKDSYVYSPEHRHKLERELNALQKLSVEADLVEHLPLPFPTAGAVRFKNQAQFNPLKLISSLSDGLNICEHTEAQAFEGNTVITNHGKIHAENIIIATHFPIINKHGFYFLKMFQHRSYVMALENAPQLNGMYVDEAADGLSFRNCGDLLLIGGGAHRTGKKGCGWEELEHFCERCYPTSCELYRWAAQDCMTLDGIPYIGRYSARTANLYVATGFNKWGMTSSMTAALLLRDMITGKHNPYAGIFSPSRSILRTQLFINIFETAVHLMSLSKPRCPHMGCALKWNRHEHSWDCPCHGSRFSGNGRLLNNPATGDLKKL